MFPEDNMTRYTNSFGDRIPTLIAFVFDAVSQETTKTGSRLKFGVFMWL